MPPLPAAAADGAARAASVLMVTGYSDGAAGLADNMPPIAPPPAITDFAAVRRSSYPMPPSPALRVLVAASARWT